LWKNKQTNKPPTLYGFSEFWFTTEELGKEDCWDLDDDMTDPCGVLEEGGVCVVCALPPRPVWVGAPPDVGSGIPVWKKDCITGGM